LVELWKIIATAVITAISVNFFGYIKERKTSSTKYIEETLKKFMYLFIKY